MQTGAPATERKLCSYRELGSEESRSSWIFEKLSARCWQGMIRSRPRSPGEPRSIGRACDPSYPRPTEARPLLCSGAGLDSGAVLGGGIALDAIPSQFCAGEMEAAVIKAFEDEDPDVIIIEGQGALSHPACSTSSFILRGSRPDGVVLQRPWTLSPLRLPADGDADTRERDPSHPDLCQDQGHRPDDQPREHARVGDRQRDFRVRIDLYKIYSNARILVERMAGCGIHVIASPTSKTSKRCAVQGAPHVWP